MKDIKKFKDDNKLKNNREAVADVKFEYQLKHDELSCFKDKSKGREVNIIILQPKGDSTFPFYDKRFTKCIGFLTDDYLIPKSKEMSFYPRSEQFDRIKHFLMNSKYSYSSEFYSYWY